MRTTIVTLSLVALLLSTGCCSGGADGTLKLDKRLEVDLREGDHQSMGVQVTAADPGWQAGVDMLYQYAMPRLRQAGLAPSVAERSSGDLTLEVRLIEYYPVSKAGRFWLGIFLGPARLTASCVLKDAEGAVIAQGAVGSWTTSRGCTELIMDYTATKLVAFLQGSGELVGGGG